MNYSTALFLFNEKLRCVAVAYEPTKESSKTLFKTLDPMIEVGDFVVIPTDSRYNMTVAKVIEVDVDVDFESPIQMQWIIGIVDRKSYEETLTNEGRAIAKMKSAEAHRKREELKKSMFAEHAASFEGVALLENSADTK
jgi:FKBP-type peptidyl-prolyl cis-trans isomerase 2